MAHIGRLVRKGSAQRELFAAGLRLDELFDEELEGLDELERDYLTRIAARLPADFTTLQRDFDEDPLLPRLLDKLTGSRLLRMSGATYDTYNDVFKEYLLYRRIPEYRQAFIHRLYPRAVFRLFHDLVDDKKCTLDELQQKAAATRGTTYNLIRELRNVGLLKKEGDQWTVPQVVVDVCNRGSLGDYVRRHMMDNAVISDLVERLNKLGEIPQDALAKYLHDRFPFIQATGKTWETYATMTLSWLRLVRLVDVRNGRLILPSQGRPEILESLGNLTEPGRNTRRRSPSADSIFLPGSHWSTTRSAALALLRGDNELSKEENKGLANLRRLRLVDTNDSPLFSDEQDLIGKVRDILQAEPYHHIWAKIDTGQEIYSVVASMDTSEAAEATIQWRCKVFAHWGRELGLVKQKRFVQARSRPGTDKRRQPATDQQTAAYGAPPATEP